MSKERIGMVVEPDGAILQKGHQMIERSHEEPSRALFAAWQNSAIDQSNSKEDRMMQKQFLHNVIENTLASHPGPRRRRAINHFSEVLNYFWFGNDHTPLPQALKRYTIPSFYKTPVISLDYNQLTRSEYRAVWELAEPLGLGKLTNYRNTHFEEQAEILLRPLVHALATNTPGYRLMESFNTSERKWEERLLTPDERLLEEKTAEEIIRRRHKLSQNANLLEHPGARKDLTRAIQRIEDVTRYDFKHSPVKDSPTDRARTFFKKIIGGELGGIIKGSSIHSIISAQDTFTITTDVESVNWIDESLVTWIESKGLLKAPNIHFLNSLSTSVVSDIALELFKQGNNPSSYTEILEAVTDKYVNYLFKFLKNFTKDSLSFPQVGTFLLAPTELEEQLGSIDVTYPLHESFDVPSRLASRKEYREMDKQTKGKIIKRPVQDTDMRLIQYTRLKDVPAFSDQAELILQMNDLPEDLAPKIFGYELVNFDKDQRHYGFRLLAEADPYVPFPTRLPNGARKSLAKKYADIGLHELSMLVYSNQDLTVSQLADIIGRTNKYALPSQSSSVELPDSLDEYRAQVEDGRLSMQCIGASHFLRLSLEEIFGSDCAGVVGGDALPKYGRRISEAGHQQTTFVDPETQKLYILDATSSAANIQLWRDTISGYLDFMRRSFTTSTLKAEIQHRTAPVQEKPHHFVTAEDRLINQEELKNSMLKHNKDSLIMHLRMFYGTNGQPISQEDLFERVARLRSDDLVFRTLSVTILSTRNESITSEEIDQILKYIRSIRDCDDPDLVRKVDPKEYNKQPRLLNSLEAALTEIKHFKHSTN